MSNQKKVDEFVVMPAGEMRKKYGLTAENRPIVRLDPEKIPEKLRPLLPWAEKFGIGDDLIREDVVIKTPKQVLGEFRRIVALHEDLLEEWLCGPESAGPRYSDEFLAFSCMLMAFDCC